MHIKNGNAKHSDEGQKTLHGLLVCFSLETIYGIELIPGHGIWRERVPITIALTTGLPVLPSKKPGFCSECGVFPGLGFHQAETCGMWPEGEVALRNTIQHTLNGIN
jgi:hypothetical protein